MSHERQECMGGGGVRRRRGWAQAHPCRPAATWDLTQWGWKRMGLEGEGQGHCVGQRRGEEEGLLLGSQVC